MLCGNVAGAEGNCALSSDCWYAAGTPMAWSAGMTLLSDHGPESTKATAG